MSVLFVSGIDTDIGKTYATGMIAKALMTQGISVITQKLVQTGVTIDNNGTMSIADDIITHRRLMGIPLQSYDLDFTTCPYRYQKPASPHLAVKLANAVLDPKVVDNATRCLQADYDVVLLEGAGGLLVPITEQLLTLDFIATQGYPIVLVTSGRLGSINHTLLSLEAIKARGLSVHSIVYNPIHDTSLNTDNEIATSTIEFLKNHIQQYYPTTYWLQLPYLNDTTLPDNQTASVDKAWVLPSNFI
ncbi:MULTISPECIES: dethiobiotin synthase [unclassified Psychrobacter]|uniref:dethiobiotin synthase n=2 Tax=Psychrobacter TaxID=497 RepID=UPI003F45D23E